MVTFQDVKVIFHSIGDWFGLVSNFFQGWPWPLEYMASPFWHFRDLFYAADWVWDGLDAWLADISNLWTWASEFGNWVSQRFTEIVSQVLTWSQIEQLIGYAIGVYPLTWSRFQIKINQSIAATLGLPEFTWGWLISKIQSEISGVIDLGWLFTVKFPIIDASIQDMWNRISALDWGHVIFNPIGTFGVNLNTITAWFISKRAIMDAWFDTTRVNLESDVATLKETISMEAIKAHLVDWLADELDQRW